MEKVEHFLLVLAGVAFGDLSGPVEITTLYSAIPNTTVLLSVTLLGFSARLCSQQY
jgi:hypothetical protein